jgi:SAM-dependent methyltransferase
MKIKHYNSKYFEWQKSIGEFGGKVNLFKFENFIKQNDNVVDFGCGGGYLLKNIECRNKIGVEVNKFAANVAENNGIKVVSKIEKVPDGWADVVISNHALEHILNPSEALIKLKDKLKTKGKIVFVVPFEVKNSYKENDINMHLYTWSPQNLGNLFKVTGYKVLSVKLLKTLWPPYYELLFRLFGLTVFNFISKVYSLLYGRLYEIQIVASKNSK